MWKQLKRIAGTSTPAALSPDPQAEAERLIKQFTARSSTSNLPVEVQTAQAALAPRREDAVKLGSLELADTDTPFTVKELLRALKKYKKSAPG
jgi:hypothetical protein